MAKTSRSGGLAAQATTHASRLLRHQRCAQKPAVHISRRRRLSFGGAGSSGM